MIGSVIEKESKTSLAPIKINPVGFPEATLRKNKNSVVNTIKLQSKIIEKEQENISDNGLNYDTVLSNNDCFINTNINILSDEELQSALDEIKSLISPKNIDFLKNKYNTENDSKLLSNNRISGESHSNIFSNNCNEIPVNKMLDSYSNIRFDLNGCKIVRKDNVFKKMFEELSNSSVLKSSDGLNHNEQIVQLCIDSMMPIASNIQQNESCDTYFLIDSSNECEDHSRTELLHHQFEPQESGYNFREISEVIMLI